jgi:hypothetical protein
MLGVCRVLVRRFAYGFCTVIRSINRISVASTFILRSDTELVSTLDTEERGDDEQYLNRRVCQISESILMTLTTKFNTITNVWT